MKPHIIDFLKYLESKENKKAPLVAKLLYPDKFSPINKEDLTVKRDLDLSFTNIESLPDNLTVEGSLIMYSTNIESLPDNLTVRGSLYVQGRSKIKSLPDSLYIGGSIYLEGTGIEFIPNNLKVEGSLFIYDTPLVKRMSKEEIRQEIEEKGGYIRGEVGIW